MKQKIQIYVSKNSADKTKYNSQKILDKFTKAINIRNTKSHKSDWKGGLYENKLYDDSRRCHE